ncbi:unnamed protein product [Closterium sp. NIES-53]
MAVPSGSLSGLHLPSFSTNLVSTAALKDAIVTTTTPGAQVSASGQEFASCSCRLLSHQTLLWHHRLGHPSLPHLHGMHSCLLESGLSRSLPPLPPSPAPPCLPCIEGRQRATPHSSFPPTTTPLQTLHMDVWGPARVSGQSRERCFLLVVDDYTRYTTVFPLRSKGQYAAHQLNLWPRVSLPETSPTLRWTGKVGDASVFRVWGSRAFVFDPSADKLTACAIPCVFFGFVLDTPGWQFYHPTLRRVLPSQDVTIDESCSLRLSQVDPPPGAVPGEVAVDSSAARGTASGGAELGGAGPGGVESGGAETRGAEPGGNEIGGAVPGGAEFEGVEPGGAASEGAESGGAEPQGAASSGGSCGASSRLSPQELRGGVAAGAGVTRGTAATSPGGARMRCTGAAGIGGVGGARARDSTESGAACAGGSGAGTGAGGAGAKGAGAGGAGAVDPGGAVRPRPYFVPLLQQVLGTPSSTGLTPPLLCPPPDLASRPVSPVRTTPRVSRSRPPPVPGTHAMTLRPSSIPLRVPLLPPPESSLHESAAASALVAELLDFAVACCLDYASALVAESACASPPSVGGECALGTDVLEDKQEDFECRAAAVPCFASILLAPEGDPDAPDIPTLRFCAKAITGPYSSQWQAAMDAEMTSWKSKSTYVDEVSPPGANIVDGMWIFRVKRPSGSPPAFKARYLARGFCQRTGVNYFQTFSPTQKMTTLWVLLHVAALHDYELFSLDFNTAFLQSSRHEEIWLRRPPGFTRSTTLAALGFAPSTADPSLFLRTDTSLPLFYVLVYVLQRFCFLFSSPQTTPLSTSHSLSAPPLDESVELSGPYTELVGCLIMWGMGLVLGGRGPVVLTGHADAFWVDDSAMQQSSQGYTFNLGSGSVSWRSTRSSLVLSSSSEAEIYAGAMAAQELRWLTYLLNDLGEQPCLPPQRGQLRLAYVAIRANTADVFTKTLPPSDHQRFVIVLGLLALLFLTGLRRLSPIASTATSCAPRASTPASSTPPTSTTLAASSTLDTSTIPATSTASTFGATSTASTPATTTPATTTTSTTPTSLTPLALAAAAPITRSRRSADFLSTKEVDSSSSGN